MESIEGPVGPPAEFTDWLWENAIPLDHSGPSLDTSDLQPFRALIGDARVLSLGEATHGTREFSQLKHRLLQFCVKDMGFTTFGFEAAYPDCLPINDYVLGDDSSNPAQSLTAIWCWDVDEVLDLIHWMREYNDEPGTLDKITFWGCDPLFPASALRRILDYFESADPDVARRTAEGLGPLATDFNASVYHLLGTEAKAATREAISQLLEELKTAPPEVQILGGVLAHGERVRRTLALDQVLSARADAWGETIDQRLGLLGPESRMVVWAHNIHCQRTLGVPGLETIAARLTERFGGEYVTLGFAFYEGEFRCIDQDTAEIRSFTVPPAIHGSLDAALATIDYPMYAIDLRKLPRSGPIHEWLASSPSQRFAASVWSEDWSASEMPAVSVDPRESFDILIFVRESHSARGLHNGLDYNRLPHVDALPLEVRPLPGTLDFRAGSDGALLEWSAALGFGPSAYQVNVSDGALELSRNDVPWHWWGNGIVCRTFEAAPYAGERVRFTVTVDTAKRTPSSPWLFIRVDSAADAASSQAGYNPSYAPGAPLAYAGGAECVEAEIPGDARTITIGMLLSGNGAATFRTPRFSVLN